MKEIARMRLGVLREIKNIRRFLDVMERGVKTGLPERVYPSYCFIKALAYHMNEGDLTPESIALHQELLHEFNKEGCGDA